MRDTGSVQTADGFLACDALIAMATMFVRLSVHPSVWNGIARDVENGHSRSLKVIRHCADHRGIYNFY